MQAPPVKSQPGQHIRSSENPRKFHNQDFKSLREYHIKRHELFKDETFPANINSLGAKLMTELGIQHVEWKRPRDISNDPRLVLDGVSVFDIKQTKLGDCWALAAIGSITLKQNLLEVVMPKNQGFRLKYAGIFHFRFWHFGELVEIVIDDLLPFGDGKFLSVKPNDGNEFWPCLLEKAYAKLCGSYQNLHGGDPAEAFVNLTGGIAMSFNLKNPDIQQNDLWQMVNKAGPSTLVVACTPEKLTKPNEIPGTNAPGHVNEYLQNGIVEGHAYCVTDSKQIVFKNGFENLIRVWNPWGHGEWQGRWRDSCPNWKDVRDEDRKKLHEKSENGEFWMSWKDFVQQFSVLILCNQVPDFLDWGDQSRKWYKTSFKNVWLKEINSDTFHKDSFSENPQYLLKITGADKVKKGYNVLISLMQNPRNRHKFNSDWLPIGYKLFQVDSQVKDLQEKLPGSKLHNMLVFDQKPIKTRDLNSKVKLAQGTYVIIPYTSSKDQESAFLLQVFLKSSNCTYELGTRHSPKMVTHNENVTYKTTFEQYAKKGIKMNAWDLQRYLNDDVLKEYPTSHGAFFTLEASRGILAVMDFAGTGKLDVQNFYRLEKCLSISKGIFNEIDTNQNGFLTLPGLQQAVTSAGVFPSNDLLNRLVHRYGDPAKRLNIVDFLCCMVRLLTTFKTFKTLSNDGNKVYIDQDKWMQLMMYI